jgi:hypothetical protein
MTQKTALGLGQKEHYHFVTLPPSTEALESLRCEYPAFRVPDLLWKAHTYRTVSVCAVVSCGVRHTVVDRHVPWTGQNLFSLLPSSCFSTFCNVPCPSFPSIFPSWNSKTSSLLWLHVVVCPNLIAVRSEWQFENSSKQRCTQFWLWSLVRHKAVVTGVLISP